MTFTPLLRREVTCSDDYVIALDVVYDHDIHHFAVMFNLANGEAVVRHFSQVEQAGDFASDILTVASNGVWWDNAALTSHLMDALVRGGL